MLAVAVVAAVSKYEQQLRTDSKGFVVVVVVVTC